MKKNLFNVLVIGGLYVMGGVIIKKLNDIQKEIEYFECEKGVWNTYKEDKRIKEQRAKEWQQSLRES